MRALSITLALFAAAPAFADKLPPRPAHTFSIVARDPATGQLGVAVQSHWFSVGAEVPWAEPGVGAVATQSFVEVSYGPLGLDLMRAGKTADQALQGLLAADPHKDVRQVAMVDAQGNVADWTGEHCIREAGMVKGKGFSAQSNMMERPTVPAAMARAFESTQGEFVDRLMAALEAAQREGGDIRGKQSAAILIVGPQRTGIPGKDRLFDLRVEDSKDPIGELKRLVRLGKAYNHMNAGDEATTAGNIEGALKEYATAESMVPDAESNGEMVFWHAVMLANAGRVDQSLPLFARAYRQDARWRELVGRLPAAGQLPNDPKLLERITQAR